MRRILAIVISLLAFAWNADAQIVVSNQDDFDKLGRNINDRLKKGEKQIVVQLGSGTFYFKNNHIVFNNLSYPDASVVIKGSYGTTLVGAGGMVNRTSSHKYAYLDKSAHNVDHWTDFRQCSDTAQLVNRKSKLFRIKLGSEGVEKADSMKIQVSQWFRSYVHPVTKIENGYVYFTVSNLSWNSSYKCFSINLDKGYGSQNPRYRLFYSKKFSDEEYECRAACFMNVVKCSIGSILVEGIDFAGNADAGSLFLFKNDEMGSAVIRACSFTGLHGNLASVNACSNFTFSGNTVKDCYQNCINVEVGSKNASITGNTFVNNGLERNYSHVVKCAGQNYCIANNTFRDFSYGAIGVGLWHGTKKTTSVNGVVEYNDISYSPSFQANSSNTLMDAGAIYLWTQNDEAVIRYNHIYNYKGRHSYRGIFCDDGTMNAKVYGNVIVNSGNSYAIDLRYVDNVCKTDKKANTGNRIYANVINSGLKFQGRTDGDSDCIIGSNYMPSQVMGGKNYALRNIKTSSEDKAVDILDASEDGILILPKSQKKMLKKSGVWAYCRRWLRFQ